MLILMRWLDRSWRLIATGIAFSIFGLGGLFLSLVWIPLASFVFRKSSARQDFAQRCIQRCFRAFSSAIKALGIIDYRIENADRLRGDSGRIIIANHPSLLDFVLLVSMMPQCDCIVKEGLWQNWFLRGIVRASGYIPNTSGEALLDACHERLRKGRRLLIFPEGTRTTPNHAPVLRRGAANMAIRCRSEIRITHIHCNPPLLHKQQAWWRVPSERPFFKIVVGECIATEPFIAKAPTERAAVLKLHEYLTCVYREPAH